jgi:hypothetical protein
VSGGCWCPALPLRAARESARSLVKSPSSARGDGVRGRAGSDYSLASLAHLTWSMASTPSATTPSPITLSSSADSCAHKVSARQPSTKSG